VVIDDRQNRYAAQHVKGNVAPNWLSPTLLLATQGGLY
jgi:hypothetical protein